MKNAFTKGMTLLEIMVAMGISFAVLSVIVAFGTDIFTFQGAISGSYTTTQDAQAILKTIMSELRETAPGGNGAYPITSTGTSSVVFFSDPNSDGIEEQVTYALVGTDLYRRQIIPAGSPPTYNPASQTSSVIVRNVRNGATEPIFEYFDANYTGTSSPLVEPVSATAVRLIKISLKLDVDPRKSPLPVTFTTQVSLRNLKTNL